MADQEELEVHAAPSGGEVPDAELQRDLLDLLARHPMGLRRADLRAALAAAYADRLTPSDLAVLDTRIGHALARLKAAGHVVHQERHQRHQLRAPGRGSAARELTPPPVGDPSEFDDAEQDPLF